MTHKIHDNIIQKGVKVRQKKVTQFIELLFKNKFDKCVGASLKI